MDDKHDYSEAMGSYMAEKLEEAIRSAKRRSGNRSSLSRPHSPEARIDSRTDGQYKAQQQEGQQHHHHQPPCHGEKIPPESQYDRRVLHQDEQTLPASTQATDEAVVDDEDDDEEPRQPHDAHCRDDNDEDDEGNNKPWSTRTDADIEARLERLPMNRRRTSERFKSGREMVEEHAISVGRYKSRTRDRLGLRASGEQRSWSVS